MPGRVDELRSRYRLGAGHATLDLSHLASTSDSRTVRASVGAGQITVLVPGRGQVIADGHAGIGEVRLFGRHQDGWDVTDRVSQGDAADGTLRLHPDVGAGQIEVVRAPSGPPPALTPPPPLTPPAPPALSPVVSALSNPEVIRAAA